MNFWRAVKHLFGPKEVDFKDEIPNVHIPSEKIPDIIFDRDVGLINLGFDEKKGMYKVLVQPIEGEIRV